MRCGSPAACERKVISGGSRCTGSFPAPSGRRVPRGGGGGCGAQGGLEPRNGRHRRDRADRTDGHDRAIRCGARRCPQVALIDTDSVVVDWGDGAG